MKRSGDHAILFFFIIRMARIPLYREKLDNLSAFAREIKLHVDCFYNKRHFGKL